MSKVKTWQERVLRDKNALPKREMQAEIDELRAANARLWLEREEPHRTIQDYLYECNSLEQERDELLAKLAALEQEANEEDALRERLSGLLTKSVNAIRGEPAELSLHSWHDLPELCNGLVEKLAELEVMYLNSLADATQWQLYKLRKDAVIAAGMGKKAMRDSAAGAAPICTYDEWLANCPQSVRDWAADKIKAGAAPKEQL